MKKVLLLGATGFIGSNIASELDRRGYSWIGVSRTQSQKDARITTLDDEQTLIPWLEQKPVVVNALGRLKPHDFTLNFNQAMNEFWDGMEGVLKLLRKNPPSHLLHISSAGTFYGEAQGRPSEESDPPAPHSWYGRMKVIEEALYQQYAEEKGVTYTCARVTNPFGNVNHPTHGLIDVLIDHVNRGEPFQACFREGACRDFIYAPEMAVALVTMIEQPVKGVFNLGRGEATALMQLIELVRELAPGAQIVEVPANEFDVAVSAVSTQRFLAVYKHQPSQLSVYDYLQKNISQVKA